MPGILIVDDSPVFRETIHEILTYELPHVDLVKAVDGSQALQEINSWHPTIILMDVDLGEHSGFDLTAEITALHPDITVIIFSGHDMPPYQAKAYQSGAGFFLSKSSDSLRTVIELIESLLNKDTAQD